jgi:hypothetical protein
LSSFSSKNADLPSEVKLTWRFQGRYVKPCSGDTT